MRRRGESTKCFQSNFIVSLCVALINILGVKLIHHRHSVELPDPMPHLHSVDARARRQARAVERGYITPLPIGSRWVTVAEGIAPRLRTMAKGLEATKKMEVDLQVHTRSTAALVTIAEGLHHPGAEHLKTAARQANTAKHRSWLADSPYTDKVMHKHKATATQRSYFMQNATTQTHWDATFFIGKDFAQGAEEEGFEAESVSGYGDNATRVEKGDMEHDAERVETQNNEDEQGKKGKEVADNATRKELKDLERDIGQTMVAMIKEMKEMIVSTAAAMSKPIDTFSKEMEKSMTSIVSQVTGVQEGAYEMRARVSSLEKNMEAIAGTAVRMCERLEKVENEMSKVNIAAWGEKILNIEKYWEAYCDGMWHMARSPSNSSPSAAPEMWSDSEGTELTESGSFREAASRPSRPAARREGASGTPTAGSGHTAPCSPTPVREVASRATTSPSSRPKRQRRQAKHRA